MGHLHSTDLRLDDAGGQRSYLSAVETAAMARAWIKPGRGLGGFVDRRIQCAAVALIVLVATSGLAQAQNLNSAALNEIMIFAAEFCGEYWREGRGEEFTVGGEAQVKLEGLLSRLAELGISGAAEFSSTEYIGVLREHLRDELEDTRECRLLIWNDLKSTVLNLDKRYTESSEIQLEKAHYRLSDDAIDMNNASVGPFCCTGRVVIVRTREGDPVGYAYFFEWDGQAYNTAQGHAIVPDQRILLSGAVDLHDIDSAQKRAEISFFADRVAPRSEWVQAGQLRYRATLLDFELDERSDDPYFVMGSLDVRLDVEIAD